MHRFWINQPSRGQPRHSLHGKRVLAEKTTAVSGGIVYFADNTPLVSIEVPAGVLSYDWPADEDNSDKRNK